MIKQVCGIVKHIEDTNYDSGAGRWTGMWRGGRPAQAGRRFQLQRIQQTQSRFHVRLMSVAFFPPAQEHFPALQPLGAAEEEEGDDEGGLET